jgi:hypothetical protein
MAKPMNRLTYRGKKQEYIQKDAIANILAKMSRWNITIKDLQNALKRIGGDNG